MTSHTNREKVIDLLATWKQAIRVCHKAHVRSAAILQRKNRAFGIPVVILSTVAGTTVFATLETSPELWVKIAVGLLSVTAAVLASLQTFLGYSEMAERHKAASQKYGTLRREIEEVIAIHEKGEDLPSHYLKSVRTRWDAVDEESPSLSQDLYDKIAKDVWRGAKSHDTEQKENTPVRKREEFNADIIS